MPRRWIIALSLVWGLVLGAFAAFQAAAGLLAVGWLYLYGDDPWPAAFTDTAVPLAAAIAGLLTFAAVVALGAHLRRIWPWLDLRLQASATLRWSVLALPMLLLAGMLWTLQRQEAAAERARAAEDLIAERQAEAHRLQSARWRLDAGAGRLHIDLAAEGATGGAYTLSWEAHGPGTAELLGAGTIARSLPAGPAAFSLELDAAGLARRYAEAILSRPEAVAIDLPLTVELSLAREGGAAADAALRLTAALSFDYRPDGAVSFASTGP